MAILPHVTLLQRTVHGVLVTPHANLLQASFVRQDSVTAIHSIVEILASGEHALAQTPAAAVLEEAASAAVRVRPATTTYAKGIVRTRQAHALSETGIRAAVGPRA
jgi:hypothetical protein